MDEVHFYCVICGAPMKAGKDLAEGVCECPKCFRFVPVPPPSAEIATEWPRVYPPDIIGIEIKFPCSECGSKLEVDAREAGSTVYCPVCTGKIQAPHLAFLIMPPLTAAKTSQVDFARSAARLTAQEIEFLSDAKPDARSSVAKPPPHASKR